MTSQTKISSGSKPAQEIQRRGTASISPWDEMDRLFDSVFPRSMSRFAPWLRPDWTSRLEAKMPAVDIIDRPDHILLRAEIPGAKKEDLDVSVSENLITIRAATKYEEEKEQGEYYRREISRGEYSRSINLPVNVDGAEAKASFKDGILELTLPKIAPSKRRSIKVE